MDTYTKRPPARVRPRIAPLEKPGGEDRDLGHLIDPTRQGRQWMPEHLPSEPDDTWLPTPDFTWRGANPDVGIQLEEDDLNAEPALREVNRRRVFDHLVALVRRQALGRLVG